MSFVTGQAPAVASFAEQLPWDGVPYFRPGSQSHAAAYITYKTYKSQMTVEKRLFPVLDFTIFEGHIH
ncbi:hypothetical protein DDIC_13545 [Desulfovibrio desulfuricans]|uniref:Uncharacterized protein n=1 Tax=Desulfovibrio desulfuricans TaxID=876 RepID=A0A4P7UPQ9_DESDE|nr:hypothetical protein [Desulfovibrio desulfuricans]QCC86881.1 hypothetical protein DDIC_13545 [Desulfovibrio desulfuricans]